MTIQIESEIIKGMAGEVKYHTKPCPYSVSGVGNVPAMVGSTQCMMCQYYGGTDDNEVTCNHD